MVSIGSLSVDVEFDTERFDQELSRLESRKIPPIQVELEPILDSFNRAINRANLEVPVKANLKFEIDDKQIDKIQEALKGNASEIGRVIKSEFEKVRVADDLKNIINLVTAPIRGIFNGIFEGFGQAISQSVFAKSINSFQKEIGVSLREVGEEFGSTVGKSVKKALDKLNIEVPDDLASNITREARQKAQQATQAFTQEPEQKPKSAQLTKGGLLRGPPGEGISSAEARAQVEAARKKLENEFNQLKRLPANAESSKQLQEFLQKIAKLEAKIAEDVKNRNIPESVRRTLAALKASNSKINQLKVEANRLAFIASQSGARSDSPAFSRVGTGAAGRLNQQALSEQAAAQANFRRLAAEFSRLSGSAQSNLPRLGFDDSFRRGQGAYNPSANRITLSAAARSELARGNLSEEVVKAVSHEFRHAIALAFGRISERDLVAGAKPGVNLLTKVSGQGRQDVESSVRDYAGKYRAAFGQEASPQLLSTIRKLEVDAVAFEEKVSKLLPSINKLLTPFQRLSESANRGAKQAGVTLSRTGADLDAEIIKSTPAFDVFIDRIYRRAEALFYRRLLKKAPPAERRSLMSEATGFAVSGAALYNPKALAKFAALPLSLPALPLTLAFQPIIGMITNLFGGIRRSLEQMEPLQQRFNFIGGGQEGGQKELAFAEGVSSKLSTSLQGGLEQFSKLAIAAKQTALEGEGVKDLYEGIATAGKALRLGQQDLNLVMYGFTQILSKGKLSAEEVRLQIAEKLPGAVGLFARALGVSQQEFSRLLESGSLLAEDVLPKVAKQMKAEFGDAAKNASLSAVNAFQEFENSVFKLQTSMAEVFGPAIAVAFTAFSKLTQFVADHAKKLAGIASTVMVGVVAQFVAGLALTMNASGVMAKVTTVIAPFFGRLFATLTPFVVGILADFLDDVFGAQTSLMDNMKNSVSQIIYSIYELVTSAFAAIRDVIPVGFLKEVFGGLIKLLKQLADIIPSPVVEFGALMLMLVQLTALTKLATIPVFGQLIASVQKVAVAFLASVRNGKVLESSLNTLTAGLNSVQLRTAAVAAAFFLLFSKADFGNELKIQFDKFGDAALENLKKVQEATDSLSAAIKGVSGEQSIDFKSKGFDLTLGLGEAIGLGKYTTDDLIKNVRGVQENYYKGLLEQSRIGQKQFEDYSRGIQEQGVTVAEKQFNDNKIALAKRLDDSQRLVDQSGLLTGRFGSNEAGRSLSQIKQIDEGIKALQYKRQDIPIDIAGATAQQQAELNKIDQIIADKLKQRSTAGKPITGLQEGLASELKNLQDTVEAIQKSDLPPEAKDQLNNPVKTTIQLLEKARVKLDDLGGSDLSPLAAQFQKVNEEIQKSRGILDRANLDIQKEGLKSQINIKNQLLGESLSPEQAQFNIGKQQQSELEKRQQSLADFVEERKKQLRDLRAIPSPTKDQQDLIKNTTQELEQSEIEKLQIESQIADSKLSLKQQVEEQATSTIEKEAAKREAITRKEESEAITSIRRRQLANNITEKQAAEEIAKQQMKTLQQQEGAAQEQLDAYRKAYQSGQISAKEYMDKERELVTQLSDFKRQKIEQEIAIRDAANQRILDDLEFANRKAEAAITQSTNQRILEIKRSQLQGLPESEAAKQIESAQSESLKQQIEETKKKINQVNDLKKQGIKTDRDATLEQIQLQEQLGQQQIELADQEIAATRRLREEQTKLIDDQIQARERLFEKANSEIDIKNKGLEIQQKELDLLEKADDLSKQLLESRQNLAKALSEASIGQTQIKLDQFSRGQELFNKITSDSNVTGGTAEGRYLQATIGSQLKDAGINVDVGRASKLRELAGQGDAEAQRQLNRIETSILEARAKLEDEMAQKKLTALGLEQEFQRRSLEMDLRRNELQSRTALFAARQAELQVQQSELQLKNQLEIAKLEEQKAKLIEDQTERQKALLEAQNKQDLASQSLDQLPAQAAAAKQLTKLAEESLSAQTELANAAKAAQEANQANERSQFAASEAARKQAEALQKAEAAAKGISVESEKAAKASESQAMIQGGLSFSNLSYKDQQELDRAKQAFDAAGSDQGRLLQSALSSMGGNRFFNLLLEQSGYGDIAKISSKFKDNPIQVGQIAAKAQLNNKDVVEELKRLNEKLDTLGRPNVNVSTATPLEDTIKIMRNMR